MFYTNTRRLYDLLRFGAFLKGNVQSCDEMFADKVSEEDFLVNCYFVFQANTELFDDCRLSVCLSPCTDIRRHSAAKIQRITNQWSRPWTSELSFQSRCQPPKLRGTSHSITQGRIARLMLALNQLSLSINHTVSWERRHNFWEFINGNKEVSEWIW